jgi:hypothetical protein
MKIGLREQYNLPGTIILVLLNLGFADKERRLRQASRLP